MDGLHRQEHHLLLALTPTRQAGTRRGSGSRSLLRLFFCVALAIGGAGCRDDADAGRLATGPDSSRVAREVGAMLEASAASWNAGDLDGFLDDYADDPGLTFVGGGTVIRGRAEVRRRYLESYWAPGSTRDSLRFRDLEIRPLGPGHALAHGRYELYRPGDGVDVTGRGRFTLVLRMEDDRWSILHDHSSSDPGQGEG